MAQDVDATSNKNRVSYKNKVIKNKDLIISSCLFALLVGLFCFVNKSFEEYSPSAVQMANQITARGVFALLNLLRIKSWLSGSTISMQQGGALKIIYECTGVYIFLIFTAFILSYPALINQKLLGLVIFIPIFIFLNLVRILSLAIIQLHWPSSLDFVHRYLWEATFMVLVMAAVYLWLLWIDGRLSSRFPRGRDILKTAVKFILFSCLGYGALIGFFRLYLFLLQGVVNAALALSWRYWLDYWPMRLVVEQNDLWLVYARGRVHIQDVPFMIPNLIPFISLMLVSRLRPRVKVAGIVAGSMILFGYHAATLILVIQKMAQRWLYLYTFFRIYLLFLLPVILWAAFFFFFREREKQVGEIAQSCHHSSSLNPQAKSRTRRRLAKGSSLASAERSARLTDPDGTHVSSSDPAKRSSDNAASAAAASGGSIALVLFGPALSLLILLFAHEPGPGYYLGFLLWLAALVLIMPKSTFLSNAQGSKRTVRLALLAVLFWQGTITASSLIYVPEGKMALFLRGDQPSSWADAGFHLGFYLAQKPIFFDLQDRKIRLQIRVELRKDPKPLLAAELVVGYRLSERCDLARIYTDLGGSMEAIDQALIDRLKQRISAELQASLPDIISGRLGGGSQIRSLIMKVLEQALSPYRIEVRGLEIVNQENSRINL